MRADLFGVEQARRGGHMCYITDLSRMRSHYPDWNITRSLEDMVIEIADAWRVRLGA